MLSHSCNSKVGLRLSKLGVRISVLLGLTLRNCQSIWSNLLRTLLILLHISILVFFLNFVSLCWMVRWRVIDFSIVFKYNVLISKRLFWVVSQCFESRSSSMRNLTSDFIVIFIWPISPLSVGEALLILSHSKSSCIHASPRECLNLGSVRLLSVKDHICSFFTIWLRNTLLVERSLGLWISVMTSNDLFINSSLLFLFLFTNWPSNKSFSFKRNWVTKLNRIYLKLLTWRILSCHRLSVLFYQLSFWKLSRGFI